MNNIYVANYAFMDDVDAIHDDPGDVDLFMMAHPNSVDPAFTKLSNAEWMYLRDILVKEYRSMCDEPGVITWSPIDEGSHMWSQKMFDDGELIALLIVRQIGLI